MTIQKTVTVGFFALVMLLSFSTFVIADCERCQTQSGDVDCSDKPVKWAKGNPEEIAPGGTKKIAVKCGTSPYTWSVSGAGFSLADSQTAGITNDLIADATACGLATITVTDNDNAMGPCAAIQSVPLTPTNV